MCPPDRDHEWRNRDDRGDDAQLGGNSDNWWEEQCSPDALKEAAQRQTGLTEYGDAYFEEGLQRLVKSLENDANLNEGGKRSIREWLKLRLMTRLYMQESLDKWGGEIDGARPEQPMFVIGFPRTGTTLLYNLLACDPEAHSPVLWEAFDPAPPPARTGKTAKRGRIDRCQVMLDAACDAIRAANRDGQDGNQIHDFGCATAREECHPLLAP